MSTENGSAAPESWTDHDVEWAAVCQCGWAASSTGTTAGRSRIESLGVAHDRECDDRVALERRHEDHTAHVRDLTERWSA